MSKSLKWILACAGIVCAAQMTQAAAITKIAAGGYHSLAQITNGTAAWAWGHNQYGQLGQLGGGSGNGVANETLPVQVTNMADMAAVGAGYYHSLALKTNGTVWAWGYNYYGQLGDGTANSTYNPVQVTNMAGATAIAGGYFFSLALKTNGTVWAWGDNSYGQLGNGAGNSTALSPVQVTNMANAAAIAGGYLHSLAVKTNGTAWAWGYNGYGQLGDGTFNSASQPVQVTNMAGAAAVAGGFLHSLALKTNGTVWAWGDNEYGQLGGGAANSYYEPTPLQVSNISAVAAIAAAGMHSLALKINGTVWAWGDNSYGQLGNGTFISTNRAVQVTGLSNVVAIAAGGMHSMAVKDDGSVWAWGYNYYGQVGYGRTVNTNLPTLVGFDYTVPKPATVIASHGAYTNQVRVTWSAVAGADHYDVYQVPPSEYPCGGNAITYLVSGTNYDATGMDPLVTNYYYVIAVSNGYGSGYSTNSSGWCLPALPAPMGVSASDGLYTNKVIVTWDAVAGATNYQVYKTISAGIPGDIDHEISSGAGNNIGATNGTSYEDTSADTNAHCYRVRAISASGKSIFSAGDMGSGAPVGPDAWDPGDDTVAGATKLGAASSEQSHGPHTLSDTDLYDWFKVYLVAGTPCNFNTAGGSGDDYGELYNDAAGTNRVAYDDDSGGNYQFSLDYTPPASGWYYLRARAYSPSNTILYTLKYNGTFDFSPVAPTGVTASKGTYANKVQVTWNAVTNATGYQVWRNTTNVTASAANLAETTNVIYNDTSALTNITYYYWLKSTNQFGAGDFSASDTGWRGSVTPVIVSSGVSADYDGDGKADPAVYDEATGTWRIKLSGANYYQVVTTFGGLGGPGFASVSADYDGDKKADPAVYYEQAGRWAIMLSSANYEVVVVLSQTLGGPGYSGMPADYDGDYKADPGVYQREHGDWKVLLSSANYYLVEVLALIGGTGYLAVAADYDGDKKADPAVYHEQAGRWAIMLSSANYAVVVALTQTLGGVGYIPCPADYDGDGFADPAVRSTTSSAWLVMLSTAGYAIVPLTLPFE